MQIYWNDPLVSRVDHLLSTFFDCWFGTRGWHNFQTGTNKFYTSEVAEKKRSEVCRLYLYYDERRDIRWNIAWARGNSQGRSPRDFLRLRLYFTYIPTWVRIQTFSISKSYTSSIVLPGRPILEELILCIGLAAGAIFFPYCSVDDAIWVRIDPVENSVVAALGNKHGQDSNTRRVKFQ